MSRYMMIMRSTPEAEAALAEQDIDFDEIIAEMGRYNEELIKAGVMVAGEGLTDPEEGFVVDFGTDDPTVTDGPYPTARWLLDHRRAVQGRGQEVGGEVPAGHRRDTGGAAYRRRRGVPAGQRVGSA